MLTLHNLKKNKEIKKSKRVGRGNSSGVGTYSKRGMKGQRSRSGGKSGLMARSIKSYLLRIPKVKGFKSFKPKYEIVNIKDLENNFKDGDKVNARALIKLGLIKTIANGIKILSVGDLKKKLTVEANSFSAEAKRKIEEAGGETKVIEVKKVEKKSYQERIEEKESKKENK